ncbi:MAG: STAS domain-containing protein [Candidatus Omnitrophica bacterium]|nr:STAS domain-containing protein [Candidatus Omnitrophota bacterium]
MSLDIKVIKKRDYVYSIELTGSLDNDTASDLEAELKEIIDEKTKVVMFDMSNVEYVSSAGIRVVMLAKKTLEQKQAKFAMVNLKPQIEKVFEVVKILPMIDIFDDMPEADKYIDQMIKDELEKQNT